MDLERKKKEGMKLTGMLKEEFTELLNEEINREFDVISDALRAQGFVWKARIEISFDPELVNEMVDKGELDEKQADEYVRAFEGFVS